MPNTAYTVSIQVMTVLIVMHIHFSFLTAKKERDEWVDKNAYDPYGKLVAAPTKLKNVRYCMGRNFIVHGHIIVHQEIAYFYKRLWVN